MSGPAPDHFLQVLALYALTALMEILGCYLPWRFLKADGSVWLLLPAALCLTAFVWLLSLHPAASGRVYAAYGAVYICMALLWLWVVDGVKPSLWDVAGVASCLCGSALIVIGNARRVAV